MLEVKKFSAAWCGPCRALKPVFEEVKSQYSNVTFVEHDVDTDYEAAAQYGIRSVPTVVLVKDGKEIERFTGVQSKLAYINSINDNIN